MEQRQTVLIDSLERGYGLMVVTLNRPERRNAFDRLMIDELREVFVEIGDRKSVV